MMKPVIRTAVKDFDICNTVRWSTSYFASTMPVVSNAVLASRVIFMISAAFHQTIVLASMFLSV